MIHSGRKAALFMIQDQLSRGHRITVILRALRIPSSTYYDWLKWHPKSRNRRRIKLKELVQVLWQKGVYLATAYDPKARKVLAWQVGQQMTQDLAVAPIQALIHQGYTFKMVHSDMGSQYTSRVFVTTLTDAHQRHSD